MLVTFEGTEFQFELEDLTLGEARYIMRHTGLTVRGLMQGLEDMNPDSLAALYWLMCKQNGQVKDINKLDFSVLRFAEALGSAFDAEDDSDGEADPTTADPAASQA